MRQVICINPSIARQVEIYKMPSYSRIEKLRVKKIFDDNKSEYNGLRR